MYICIYNIYICVCVESNNDESNKKARDRDMQSTYNHFHNILRLFDVLPNFPFTTSKTMGDYYL